MMSNLKIKDAPLLPTLLGSEKIPTGGRGNFTTSADQLKDYIAKDLQVNVDAEISRLDAVDASLDTRIDSTNLDISQNTGRITAVEVKVSTVAIGATANATNEQLRNRTTHTGVQPISSISNLQTELNNRSLVGHTHTQQQVTGLVTRLSGIENSVDQVEGSVEAESQARILFEGRRDNPHQVIAGQIPYSSPFAGAITRSQADKNAESVSVKDFGAIGDGTYHPLSERFATVGAAQIAYPNAGITALTQSIDWAAIQSACNASLEGAMLHFPAGDYYVNSTIISKPMLFIGQGQGLTKISFDNTTQKDGIVFLQNAVFETSAGLFDLTISTRNGHGRYAVDTTSFRNVLRPKFFLNRVSFSSYYTEVLTDSFAQKYSWVYMLHLGDSWDMSLSDIDAVGCFVTAANPATQFLDGFVRFNATNGILSCRINNLTTHNVAKAIEVRKRTYFSLSSVDIARSYMGVFDAPDRVYETNEFGYGESLWANVVINSTKACIDLTNRYALGVYGLVLHRSVDAFDTGEDWYGLKLSRSQNTTLDGVTVSAGGTLATSKKIGILIDAGYTNHIGKLNVGVVDVGVQVGVAGSPNGAAQSVTISSVALFANVTAVIDVNSARGLRVNSFTKSSAFTFTNFALFTGDSSSYTTTSLANCPADRVIFRNDKLLTDRKLWAFAYNDTAINLQTLNDNGVFRQNVVLLKRPDSADVTEVELRPAAGGTVYANGQLLTRPFSITNTPELATGTCYFKTVSNTQVQFSYVGDDGVTRSTTFTLS